MVWRAVFTKLPQFTICDRMKIYCSFKSYCFQISYDICNRMRLQISVKTVYSDLFRNQATAVYIFYSCEIRAYIYTGPLQMMAE